MPEPEQPSFESPLPTGIVPASDNPGGTPPDFAAVLPPLPPRKLVFPPWSVWDVTAVFCFTVAAVFLFSTIALGVAHLFTSKQHVSWNDLASNTKVLIGAQVAAYPAVILFMVLMLRSRSEAGFWKTIRWQWPGAAALSFFVSGTIVAVVVEYASHWLPIPKSLPVDKYFSDIGGAYLMAIFGITLAPLLEELFFRGLMYPVVRRATGVAVGVVLTAVAFALIHGAQLGYAWAPLVSIFVVGVIFTVVRERTASVAASFLMHCGYNFTLFTMLWIGSDHFRHLDKVACWGWYR